jgi:HAD superfamily hydrolase (TIGR01509 family)
MGKYKCVIFDCDGVLVDSETLGNTVLVNMANALGANITLEYALKHFKGGTIKGVVEQIERLTGRPAPSNFQDEYRKTSYELFKKEIKPIKGIIEVLDNLKESFCVASSGPETKIKLNLECIGLLDYFENKIFSCYTIQKWKPDPAVFLWAAKSMGYKPEECIVIEDSITGVRAAKNGGFDVFGFTEHDYNNELEKEATHTFAKMEQLINLLNK